MSRIRTRIDERGILLRDSEQLLVRRKLGGRMTVEEGVGIDPTIGMPGRLIGTVVGEGAVALERFIADASIRPG